MKDKEYWFEPKKLGYGAGLPIHWKGWALLLSYTLLMLSPAPFLEDDPIVGLGFAAAIWIPATLAVIFIAERKTRGGWRFRSGGED